MCWILCGEDFKANFDVFEVRPDVNMRSYFLRDCDGDYVECIEDGKTATIPVHFFFTANHAKASRFTHDELWGPGQLGVQFSRGYAGGRAEYAPSWKFYWSHPRKSWQAARKPIGIDLGGKILWIKNSYAQELSEGWGIYEQHEDFILRLCNEVGQRQRKEQT
jgi:hypothetical protein